MFDGFFGNLFDMNHDGELDTFERTMDYIAYEELTTEVENNEEEDDFMTDLELSGLDYDELEFMDEDERREVLEEAGLDPEDYDF